MHSSTLNIYPGRNTDITILYIYTYVHCITVPHSSASMGSIYAEHKDEDGFLYVAYSGENTFGQ